MLATEKHERVTAAVATHRMPFLWRVLPPRMQVAPSVQEALRIERVIAVARLLLTAVALLVTRIEPVASTRPVWLLLIFFSAYSMWALLVLRTRQRATAAFVRTTHT